MNRRAWTIAAACGIDALFGDPAWFPHPVRALGAAIEVGDRYLNAGGRGSRLAGAALALVVIGAGAGAGAAVRNSPVASALLGATTIAARDLLTEVDAVATALEHGDLARARSRVGRIVGRDTAGLGAADVARAAIETLGESTCDGIVAPLFWFAVWGLPGALAFKAVSTLDSMIGHREPRYLRFGAFAARTDDVLNYLPARITAFFIALTADAPLEVARRTLRDAWRHLSPNAGWPEAALGSALGVRLGGPNAYDGMLIDAAFLNADGRCPDANDVRLAMRLVRRVAVLAETFAVGACALRAFA